MYYDIGKGLTLNADWGQKGNRLFASCTIYNNGREIKNFDITTPLGPIQKRVLKYLANNTGWGWSDLKKSAKKIAKKVGVKRIAKSVYRIAKDPRFKKGLLMASTIYPPLGITYSAVQKSANLLTAARSGDTDAQMRLIEIANLAKQGNVKAAKISRALMVMNQAAKRGADVSGWAYNLPYRTGSPVTPFRNEYNEGMMMRLRMAA